MSQGKYSWGCECVGEVTFCLQSLSWVTAALSLSSSSDSGICLTILILMLFQWEGGKEAKCQFDDLGICSWHHFGCWHLASECLTLSPVSTLDASFLFIHTLGCTDVDSRGLVPDSHIGKPGLSPQWLAPTSAQLWLQWTFGEPANAWSLSLRP